MSWRAQYLAADEEVLTDYIEMKDDFNDYETTEFTETLLTFMTLLQPKALQTHNPGQGTSFTRGLLERKLMKRSFSDFE